MHYSVIFFNLIFGPFVQEFCLHGKTHNAIDAKYNTSTRVVLTMDVR